VINPIFNLVSGEDEDGIEKEKTQDEGRNPPVWNGLHDVQHKGKKRQKGA
jgi:hypothetical protein